jgi:hypothetical protein
LPLSQQHQPSPWTSPLVSAHHAVNDPSSTHPCKANSPTKNPRPWEPEQEQSTSSVVRAHPLARQTWQNPVSTASPVHSYCGLHPNFVYCCNRCRSLSSFLFGPAQSRLKKRDSSGHERWVKILVRARNKLVACCKIQCICT